MNEQVACHSKVDESTSHEREIEIAFKIVLGATDDTRFSDHEIRKSAHLLRCSLGALCVIERAENELKLPLISFH